MPAFTPSTTIAGANHRGSHLGKGNNVGKAVRQCWPPAAAVGILLFALQGTFWAQGAKTSAVDRAIYVSLRDVANYGADLFNKQGDWAGCYRVYEGALLGVKPLLAHRPDLQGAIDAGIEAAGQEGRVSDRAFALRKVIDQVRAKLKTSGPATIDKKVPEEKKPIEKKPVEKKPVEKKPAEKKPVEKKPIEKKPEEKKPIEKKPVDKKDKDKEKKEPKKIDTRKEEPKKIEKKAPGGSLSGSVLLDGKPAPLGFVTIVSAADKRSYSTMIGADGTYRFRSPIPPGKYAVIIEAAEKGQAANIPERYRNAATSGITIDVGPSPAAIEIQLKR